MLLNYKQTGQGPNLVLIHGLFGSLENLNVIAKALSQHFTVINVDLRNHGGSFHDEQMNYQVMADDICTLMKHLNIDNAHLVGHSMGGKVAMQVALKTPERVNKLVVLDIAPVDYQPRHNEIINALKLVSQSTVNSRSEADKLMSSSINIAGVRQFLLKSLAKTDSGYSWKFNLPVISDNYSTIISNIDTKAKSDHATLFVKGNDSDYILPEHRDMIVSLFPNSKAKVIHGAGHWLHAEKPAAVNRTILDFLQ